MRPQSLSVSSRRPALRVGLLTVSAALAGAAFAPAPAVAQATNGYGQRANGPSSIFQPPPAFPFAPPPAFPQAAPPAFPQSMRPTLPQQSQMRPVYPQQQGPFSGRAWSNAPVYQSPYNNRQTELPGVTFRRQEPTDTQTNAQPTGTYHGRIITGKLLPIPRPTAPIGVITHEPGPSSGGDQTIRVTTPGGTRRFHGGGYDNYVYNSPITYVGGPTLLGGYYYGNYCDTYYNVNCYPAVYSNYDGFPEYIYSPGVIVVGDPYVPAYATPYEPFTPPTYQVTYNQTNYYVASEDQAQQIQSDAQSGETAPPAAVKDALPATSYQAAFADIERAWQNNDSALINRHLRDKDTKLSVFFKGKYTYSIGSGDYLQITRDALDRLSTVSFAFTRLRKAKNGDVTAYGKHVYRTTGDGDPKQDTATSDNTVPFSTDSAQPYDKNDDPVAGAEKTIYVSYTLRHEDGEWYIIALDSSPTDLVK